MWREIIKNWISLGFRWHMQMPKTECRHRTGKAERKIEWEVDDSEGL